MTASRSVGLRHYLPEPSRLWICHGPTAWPGASGLWTNLAERTLGRSARRDFPSLEPPGEADLIYLPPVDDALRGEHDRLVERFETAGIPVLTQRRPGDRQGRAEDVLDLLETLLQDGAGGLEGIETDCSLAVWPLISGLTGAVEDWQRGLDALAAAGLETVVPVVLELGPAERRRLADFTDEAGYQALFHGSPPDERGWSRLAADRGLEVMPVRPQLAAGPREQFSRLVAGTLIEAADLWLRLGHSESAGQELLRAARWVERSKQDLRALAREGNLGVLPWLDRESTAVVRDLAGGGSSALGARLMAEYLGTQ